MTALWLCVVIIALALAKASWMLTAAVYRARMENPTEQDIDAALDRMEEEVHRG